MAFTEFKRDDTTEGSELPFISITQSHVTFNAVFVRIASINSTDRVTILIDEIERKIRFKFHGTNVKNSFALNSKKDGRKNSSLQFSSKAILKNYSWVEAVAKLNMEERRFTPKKEDGMWTIQLCPAFEIKKARESVYISSDCCGIYRYLRESGEIVYIGRGYI